GAGGGDDRPRTHLDDPSLDVEILELLAQGLGVLLQLLVAHGRLLIVRRSLQKARGRELKGFGATLAEVERLLPREPFLDAGLGATGLDDHRQRRSGIADFGGRGGPGGERLGGGASPHRSAYACSA